MDPGLGRPSCLLSLDVVDQAAERPGQSESAWSCPVSRACFGTSLVSYNYLDKSDYKVERS
jgi:hypothetical protein